jgi:hypothetical protein
MDPCLHTQNTIKIKKELQSWETRAFNRSYS